jgi:hypothetical protein
MFRCNVVSQIPAILGAMDVLTAALRLPSPSAALALLVAQPSLLYDITQASIAARLEQLGVVLACSPEEARDVALQQPVGAVELLTAHNVPVFACCGSGISCFWQTFMQFPL